MVSVYWRHLRAKRIARKSSTKGVSPYAALLALVTLLIIGFIIAEFILFLLKNPTARDILSSTSSSTSSTSSSSTPTNSGLIWKIVFTGTARDAEAWTTANCSGDCPIAESDSWSWSLVYYFITNSQTTFPTSASLYLNGSSISYSGSITYTDPSNNCTFNSDSLTGSGAHDLTFSIYANGTVTNNGGDGWEPWTSVSGSTPSSPVSS